VRVYHNGQESVVPYLGYDVSNDTIAIGDNPGGVRHVDLWPEHFKGKIEEVQVYERALTRQEIRRIYKGGGSGGGPKPWDPLAKGLTWTDVTPPGEWDDVRFVTEIDGQYYLSWEEAGIGHHLYVTSDGNTFSPVIPAGNDAWAYDYLGQVGDRFYFASEALARLWVTTDGLVFTDITPPGSWLNIWPVAEIGGQAYFALADDATVDLRICATSGDRTCTDVTPEGEWWNIGKATPIGAQWVFWLQDSSDRVYLFATSDGNTFVDVTPAGDWVLAHPQTQIGDDFYFRLQDSLGYSYIYKTSDGLNFSEVDPPAGTWNVTSFVAKIGDQYLFWFRDNAVGAYLYATTDGTTFANVTPPGAWNGFHVGTESDGQWYLRFEDRSRNWYLYVTGDGTTWTDVTPGGPWPWGPIFLAEAGDQLYFAFWPSLRDYRLYAAEDGKTFVDVTPPGSWRWIRYGTEFAGRQFFTFGNTDYSYRLYATRDGCTFGDITPDGLEVEISNWNPNAFVSWIDGSPFFKFQDSSGNTRLYKAATGGYRASITVKNRKNQPMEGWTVTFYGGPGGAGGLWATLQTDVQGRAELRLPNGQYSYRVQHDCYDSGPINFRVQGHRYLKTHKTTARVTIRVADNSGRGRRGYLVRAFDPDGKPLWRRTTSDSGRAWFYLDVLEPYQFLVERCRIQSPSYPVGEGVLCGPTEEQYTLATVIVHVQDERGRDLTGYRVRVRRPDKNAYMYSSTKANGEARLLMVEGDYVYQVHERGAWSTPQALSIDPPQGSPGGVADDQRIEYVVE
jgi:hypothetical protein